MKLEQQVTSLELSKKLKELGVKHESYFAHYFNAGEPTGAIVETFLYKDASSDFKDTKLLSAFTVAELGEMLPKRCSTHKSLDNDSEWCGWYADDDHIFRANTEADARAKMWLYLKKNELI